VESALIVLGRFQPFHNGHAELINAAISYLKIGDLDMPLRICIGSSEAEQTLENPWSANEREEMIRAWLGDDLKAEIVQVPDLGDPPNYVQHAEKFHGPPGIILTSDEETAKLYVEAEWMAVTSDLVNREDWQGWRVRATIQMMSTVSDVNGIRSVLTENIPDEVVDWLIENDAIKRLAFMGMGGEPVG
jgi:nicotinamide mononucleotide adenylyltransferase